MKIYQILLIGLVWAFGSSEERWELLYDTSGVKTWQGAKKSGLRPFRSETVFDFPKAKVLKVLNDLEGRAKWAPKVLSVKVEKCEENTCFFREKYTTPWPAKDREFLLKGVVKHSGDSTFLIAQTDSSLMKLGECCEQAFAHNMTITLVELDENQTFFRFDFNGDLGGWLPNWLVNLIQRKWPLRFIQGLGFYLEDDSYRYFEQGLKPKEK
jgi:hypothetical protein